jgi:hypothetical protein
MRVGDFYHFSIYKKLERTAQMKKIIMKFNNGIKQRREQLK